MAFVVNFGIRAIFPKIVSRPRSISFREEAHEKITGCYNVVIWSLGNAGPTGWLAPTPTSMLG